MCALARLVLTRKSELLALTSKAAPEEVAVPDPSAQPHQARDGEAERVEQDERGCRKFLPK